MHERHSPAKTSGLVTVWQDPRPIAAANSRGNFPAIRQRQGRLPQFERRPSRPTIQECWSPLPTAAARPANDRSTSDQQSDRRHRVNAIPATTMMMLNSANRPISDATYGSSYNDRCYEKFRITSLQQAEVGRLPKTRVCQGQWECCCGPTQVQRNAAKFRHGESRDCVHKNNNHLAKLHLRGNCGTCQTNAIDSIVHQGVVTRLPSHQVSFRSHTSSGICSGSGPS